jgi:PleD family two-component response regulator
MADIMPWNRNKNSSKISKSADSIFDKQKQNEFKRINLDKHQYKTILIIDDEPDTLYTLKLALENSSEKYRIHTYNNPLLLLSEFKSNYYDLLLERI